MDESDLVKLLDKLRGLRELGVQTWRHITTVIHLGQLGQEVGFKHTATLQIITVAFTQAEARGE